MKKRIIIHLKAEHLRFVDEYIRIYKRCGVFPKKLNKDGFGEYYRRVIIGRLQNRTLTDIAKEHGISSERVRQIFARFQRYCNRHKYDLRRLLLETLRGDKAND